MNICVKGSRSCICWHAEGMLTWTCWSTKYGKTVQKSLLADLVSTALYLTMLFFRCKFQEARCKFSLPYFVFLSCCYGSLGKYCKIWYLWLFLDIQIKYSWNIFSSLLKYCTLHKTQFGLQYWQLYFFSWVLLPGILVYFSNLLTVKNVNLILWLNSF